MTDTYFWIAPLIAFSFFDCVHGLSSQFYIFSVLVSACFVSLEVRKEEMENSKLSTGNMCTNICVINLLLITKLIILLNHIICWR